LGLSETSIFPHRQAFGGRAWLRYYRQGYRRAGGCGHSAVKICQWTRKSLRYGKVCYKQKWYGIESHRCLQCTTSLYWCQSRCLYCWRSFDGFLGPSMNQLAVDEPSEIVDGLIDGQRRLLSGFKGNEKVDRRRWEEAQAPRNAAISLAGESLLYARISEFIEELHRRGFSTFLVTKGLAPDRLQALRVEPTNLYVSLSAPDEATMLRLEQPLVADAWSRFRQSLELMSSFRAVKVVRLTLVKGFNTGNMEGYADLIAKTSCDYVEVKAFTWIGEAQRRLPREAMPSMDEVRSFSEGLSKLTGYRVRDEFPPSRVALLSKY